MCPKVRITVRFMFEILTPGVIVFGVGAFGRHLTIHEDQDLCPYLGGHREILAHVLQMRAQGLPFSLPAREGALRRLRNVEIKPQPQTLSWLAPWACTQSLAPWTVIYKSRNCHLGHVKGLVIRLDD